MIEGSHHGDEWMGFQTAMKLIEAPVKAYRRAEVQNVSGISAPPPNRSASRLSWLVEALFNALDPDGDHRNGESDVAIAVPLAAAALVWKFRRGWLTALWKRPERPAARQDSQILTGKVNLSI
ncbi:MAG: hypothetical protein FJ149_08290 [Euryarchaeota archaeon]|nr:hypothetical protein [Euryarchaeota archaeon]